MNEPMKKLLVAQLLLCGVALVADLLWTAILSPAFSCGGCVIPLILYDEAIHAIISILSWVCFLHILKLYGFLSPLWSPVGITVVGGGKSCMFMLLFDYMLVACISCCVDFDRFIGIDNGGSLILRGFHDATHLGYRSYAHMLVLPPACVLFMSLPIVGLIKYRYRTPSIRKVLDTPNSFTSTNYHPSKQLMQFNSLTSHSHSRLNHSRNDVTDFPVSADQKHTDLLADVECHSISSRDQDKASSYTLLVKYCSLFTTAVLSHQLRDAKRRGLYIMYITDACHDWLHQHTSLTIPTAEIALSHRAFITTAPLGIFYVFFLVLLPAAVAFGVMYILHDHIGMRSASQQSKVDKVYCV